MFNQLIKKYKYIHDNVPRFRKREKILKTGQFQEDETTIPGLRADIIQKKKVISETDYRILSPASKIASGSEINKTIPQKKKETGSDRINQKLGASPADSISTGALNPKAKIRKEYETLIKTESEKSYNNGFQKGRKSGFEEGNAKAGEVRQIVENIRCEFNKKSELFFNDMENIVLDLSVHLAGKIIGEAVSMIPDIVKSNVAKCIGLLAGAGNVMIKINPGDYEAIKEYLPDIDQKHEGKYSFVLEPDHNITRGGCLIEMDGSVIDGRIETQFEKLKKHMEMLS